MRTITTALSISIMTSNYQKLISYHDQPIQISNLEAGKSNN